ncbi:MAG: DUF481 domain-containing protein [Hydrogenophaga sp.]|uniref:DUF481 domain-containing protein n=1 Tax=Hydrogenophaga sp. TaxID=1904254 RepID=UPI00260A7981|nr:DUF481 domain-containing protein [Hydrogenophaga sp.]MCV0439109.1 DUF481 domain-containing protein [Hydrogenophaga sp.]
MPRCSLSVTLSAASLLLLPALLQAQVTLKPDGQWRYLLTAGANVSSGNNNASSLNLAAEAARQTTYDKWTWGAKADHACNDGVATTERYGLRTQYDRDFSVDVSAGLGYTNDRYVVATDAEGAMRERYGRMELVLSEEATAMTATPAPTSRRPTRCS